MGSKLLDQFWAYQGTVTYQKLQKITKNSKKSQKLPKLQKNPKIVRSNFFFVYI